MRASSIAGLVWLFAIGCGGSERAASPPPTVAEAPKKAPAPAPEPEGLANDQIIPVVEARYGEVRGCHTIEYNGRDATAGTMLVDISISPEGTVTDAAVAESDFDSEQMHDCVVAVTKTLQFPKADATTELSWRFKFRAPRG